MIAKIVLTIIFLAVMVGIGVYSRKHSKSVDGFVLGGREVGPWLSAFAYATSYFSAVAFVGYAGQFGWKYGLSSSWIGVGNAFIGTMLAWVLLARRTQVMSRKLDSRTMPDFFGARFHCEGLRVVAAIISFVFLIPYTAGVYMGISKLFEVGFGAAIPYEFWATTMAVLTAVYVILGGYKATAINDFVQGLVMLLGMAALVWVVLSSQGGLSAAVAKLAELAPTAEDVAHDTVGTYTAFKAGDFASCFGPAPLAMMSVMVLCSLGTWGLPQMVSKFYSIADEAAVRRGTIIATFFTLTVAGGCFFVGGFGRLFVPNAFDAATGRFAYDAIVPHMLSGFPEALVALIMLLVLSASMSTLASLVLTSSSTVTLDLIYRDRKDREARQVVIMRVLIVCFIVISLQMALKPPQFIAQMIGISWGALAGAFLAPFMLSLYWKGVTRSAVWACFVWGVGFTTANMLTAAVRGSGFVNPIACGVLAMVGGFLVVILVSLVTPRMKREFVDGIFTCYQKPSEIK